MKESASKKAVNDEFTRLYREHQSSVYNFCLAKLNMDEHSANDCTQNTFMTLYKKMLDKEKITYPKAFLLKTANNFVLKSLSHSYREKEKNISLDTCENTAEPRVGELETAVDYSLLLDRIQKVLNEDERTLFELKYIDDLTLSQAADRLNISPAAVAKRLQRLRDKVKDSILNNMKGGE